MLLYVSGPYSADTPEGIDENITRARVIGIKLWEKGHAVITPHLNTINFETDCKATWEDYIRGDLMMIARCDGMVMTPDWETSRGAKVEYEYAQSVNLPIWVYPDVPELHMTEVRCPQQSKTFAEIVGQMYRTHLRKNRDYAAANILATGEVGLVVRLWDKIARLLNLTGFVLKVEKGEFAKPIEAANEPIEDSFMDAAVYSIIGLLLRKGVWGK